MAVLVRFKWVMIIFSASAVLRVQFAMAQPIQFPSLNIGINQAEQTGGISIPLQILLVLTVLSFIPALLIAMTSFIRIIVVLSLLRQALGIQQMPPNQVLIGLGLVLTFFIMQPAGEHIYNQAIQPYMSQEINAEVALQRAIVPLRAFMLNQVNEKDLGLFVQISRQARPQTLDDISLMNLIPAFIIGELKIAFQIGFLLYMPFLVLDLVVSSILLSVGMIMLPPILISLPFKLILFVMVDGWHLIIGSLVKSFH